MKKIIIFPLIVIVSCALFLYRYHSQNQKPFHCDGQIVSRVVMNDGENLDINLSVVLVSSSPNEIVLLLSGTVNQGDKTYIVSRNSYLRSTPSELEGVNKVVVTHENVKPKDTVPEALWANKVLPEKPGVWYYSKITKLSKNAMLVETLTNPHFICIRQ